nr:retrovirus-related Pol polyprotein from transposon TNT 1-94 [Tanacetum cinerariifolium]
MAAKYEIEKFNGNNFSLWKLKMKTILRKDKCLAAIGERPADVTDDKWGEMDENAISNLHLALADGLASLSCIIEPQERAEILLQSLPDSYDQLIISLTSNVLTDFLVFDDVAAVVLEEENRRNNREDRQASSRQVEALVVTRERSKEPGSSGSHNRGKSKTRKKKNFKCFKCGKHGHFKKDCRGSNTSYPQGNVASTSDDGNALCCEAAVANESRKRFADIIGIGSVMVKMHDSTVRTIQDVRHVKGLKKNLLSLGQLDDLGCKVEIQNKIMKIIKGALVLTRGEKVAANLYQLKGEIIEEAESSVASHSPSHRVAVSLPFCEYCVISKQHHLKFKTSNSRSVSVLELVHSDVWQAPVQSLGRAKYFVSFIDDYSRRCWVYPIKKKSDVFEVFKVYKARVELDSGTKIKCLRTDNEGEYTGDEFDLFCRKKGIKRQFTTTYTPQQNGVAERMNRTLLERARAMLATASLGKSFWAEAVNTACYVINHSPSTAIELKTPMEMWTGKPVNFSDLHIFGSLVYVMYNSQETTKLDPKSRKCLFLGYADGVKGYRLWDPTAHKVVVSKDVVFMEDKNQENEEGDGTTRETTSIQIEKQLQSNDSSEVVPQHEENKTNASQAPRTCTLNRERRPPRWYSDYDVESNVAYCLLTDEGEPSTFQEALNNSYASFWKEAMQEEIEALHKNKTWELVPLPGGRKPIGNKWVYTIKRNGDDQVERYRARLVVKGYAQKEGIDFNEIFFLVVRMTTVRVVLAMCATYDLHLEQLDVKTAFLHGNLDEEIYILQPEGFEQKGKKNLVCRLNKSLYDLKQVPRCWYKRFDSFIIGLGYNRLHANPCAYFKRFGNNDFVILLLYVDDMLVAGPNKDRISKLKAQLAREFEMKDLGPVNKILGMQIHRDRVSRKIWLSRKSYVKKILQRFNMQDCKPISTPFPTNVKLSSKMSPSSEEERMEMSRVPYASAVGSLMFAMICTRPDIAHAVGVVSRYMAEPGREHWEAVKRILRYIKGTSDVVRYT